MPEHDDIYRFEAAKYDELIAKQEDLTEELAALCNLEGADALDMGAGSGRLTVSLARRVRSVVATDASGAMLQVAASRLKATGLANWKTMQADHRRLPLAEGSFDLIVAGWSICYLCTEHDPLWRRNLNLVMEEVQRVARPGATVIIFETMGTGVRTPQPPRFLLPYYRELEERYGFRHKWLRTDYRFADAREAKRLLSFFFGDELGSVIAGQDRSVVPECAGVWWKKL